MDYLNDGNPKTTTDLGINGIWLMPITVSPRYHKYDTTNYYDIDPEYGTLKDFQTFLKEAHKRGIKVIMDLVINHTSSEHPWFISANSSEKSPYRNYYTWVNSRKPGFNSSDSDYDLSGRSSWQTAVWHPGTYGNFYGIFGAQMPDLNYDNPKVRSVIKDIAKFWLKKGVDGFRLDAALHIYGDYELPKGKT
jgi:alpha-amylase